MFKPKITIQKELYDRVKSAVEIIGAASVEEFVERTLENECNKVLNQGSNKNISQDEIDNISDKLKGLGYLD